MDLVTQRRVAVNSLNNLSSKITGVRCCKANAPNAWNLGHAHQQFRKCHAGRRGITVRINGLPEKLDFREAFIGQAKGLRKDFIRRSAALRAAGHGNNTVRTRLVATLDDGNVSAEAV